jgi:hypothetical protein
MGGAFQSSDLPMISPWCGKLRVMPPMTRVLDACLKLDRHLARRQTVVQFP